MKIKLPPVPVAETEKKRLWALRLSRQELDMLDHAARVSRTTKTALVAWLIREFYEQQIIGPARAAKKKS